jgi:hypothetical protein
MICRWSFGISLVCLAASASAAARLEVLASLDAEREILDVRTCSDVPVELRADQRALRFATATLDGQRIEQRRIRIGPGNCLTSAVDLSRLAAADRFALGGQRNLYYRLAAGDWLWRPREIDPDSRLRFVLPPGWSASVPWPSVGQNVYRYGTTPADWPALTAFGRFEIERIPVKGGHLRLAVLPLASAAARAELRDWFTAAARTYFANSGGLPVNDVQVFVAPLPGVKSALPWGEVQRGGLPAVHLYVGADAGLEAWRDDWTLAHELAHLQHPYLGERGRWLAEGLASYHQNVWRARSGDLRPEEAYSRLLAGFARGRAVAPGEALATLGRGWSNTMRIYWSGAAFWFETDLRLHTQGDSLDALLLRYRANGIAHDRRIEPEAFIADLDALAPEAGIANRYATYRRLTHFPDLGEARALLGISTPDGLPATMPQHEQLIAILAARHD